MIKSIFRFSLLLLIFQGLSSTLLAQDYEKWVEIRGKVKSLDDTGSRDTNGLAGVLVYIDNGSNQFQDLTEDAGNYFLNVEHKKRPKYLMFNYKNLYFHKIKLDWTDSTDKLRFDIILPIHKEFTEITHGTAALSEFQPYQIYGINEKEAGKTLLSHPLSGIQGKVPGLHTVGGSGAIGASTNFYLRGINSINHNSQPLFIIDGVPVLTGTQGDGRGNIGVSYGYDIDPLQDFSSLDIEKVEVVTDPALLSLYGSRGSNGVINITTRKGKAGKTKIDLNYETGIMQPSQKVELANGNKYLSELDKAFANSFSLFPDSLKSPRTRNDYINPLGIAAFSDTLANVTNRNRMDEILKNGSYQQLFASASGGNAKTKFYMAGNLRSEDGMLVGSKMDRIGARFNVDNQSGPKLNLGLNLSLNLTDYKLTPSGNSTLGGFGSAQSTALPVYPEQYPNSLAERSPYFRIGNQYFNPYDGSNISLYLDPDHVNFEKFNFRNAGSIYLNYKVHPKLVFSNTLGVDYLTSINRSYMSSFTRQSLVESTEEPVPPNNPFDQPAPILVLEPNAEATDVRYQHFTLFGKTSMTYNTSFKGIHQINATIGMEYYGNTVSFNNASIRGFSTNLVQVVNGGTRPLFPVQGATDGYAYSGFFTTVNYSLREKYALMAVLRADGSTRFGQDVGLQYYPGLSASWLAHKEDFLKNISWINSLKVHGGIGLSGNSIMPNRMAYGYWNTGLLYTDLSNYQGRHPYNVSNPMLKPENALSSEFGFELKTLSSKLTANITLFNRAVNNLILYYPTFPTLGLETTYLPQNGGGLRNSGLELMVAMNWVDKKIAGHQLIISNYLTTTWQSSQITNTDELNPGEMTDNVLPNFGFVKGEEVGTYYLPEYKGIASSDNGTLWRAGDELIVDANGNEIRPTTVQEMENNRKLIKGKSAMPRVYGSFGNMVSYAGFELDFQFTYALGVWLLDEGEWRQSYMNGANQIRANSEENPNRYYSGTIQLTDSTSSTYVDPFSQVISSRFIRNADYLRLRYLNLSYSLPRTLTDKWKLSKVKVYIAAQNLFTLSGYEGWGPEQANSSAGMANSGMGFGQVGFNVPQPRIYSTGLRIQF